MHVRRRALPLTKPLRMRCSYRTFSICFPTQNSHRSMLKHALYIRGRLRMQPQSKHGGRRRLLDIRVQDRAEAIMERRRTCKHEQTSTPALALVHCVHWVIRSSTAMSLSEQVACMSCWPTATHIRAYRTSSMQRLSSLTATLDVEGFITLSPTYCRWVDSAALTSTTEMLAEESGAYHTNP